MSLKRKLRNPLSKVKKLIDTQGETIEEANYETFTTDSCFNRVPQSEDNSNCQLDMNEYMKKRDAVIILFFFECIVIL